MAMSGWLSIRRRRVLTLLWRGIGFGLSSEVEVACRHRDRYGWPHNEGLHLTPPFARRR